MSRTQTDRVLRALQQGPVTSIAFQPPTCDGGTPILRVAARVQDLRDAGHEITTARAKNGIATYTLGATTTGEPEMASVTSATASDADSPGVGGSLFDMPAERTPHWKAA